MSSNSDYIQPGSSLWSRLTSLREAYDPLRKSVFSKAKEGGPDVFATSLSNAFQVLRPTFNADGRRPASKGDVSAHPAVVSNMVQTFKRRGVEDIESILAGDEDGLKALETFCTRMTELEKELGPSTHDITELDIPVRIAILKDDSLMARHYAIGANIPETGLKANFDSMIKSASETGYHRDVPVETALEALDAWSNSLPSIPVSWSAAAKKKIEIVAQQFRDTAGGTKSDGSSRHSAKFGASQAGEYLKPSRMVDDALTPLCFAYDANDLEEFDSIMPTFEEKTAIMRGWIEELRTARKAQSEAEERGETLYSEKDITQMSKADKMETWLSNLTQSVRELRNTLVKIKALQKESSATATEAVSEEVASTALYSSGM